ncbi:long-chain-fatty-acid--CoA ligase [Nocardia uniformis]|uniref:Long-chain-fatty-acid--CoA ligase n=1 Tax=Nocardia uniformis TaxID=53432 RepID=A0A849CA35_9NOCA|nr:long-chain-fatty-acid--CoA ligase [Nocardia uniformis]NNH74706.1 long-chain-fatty-acid--CoA ligase [Nocardia uniformis]
MYLTQGLHRAIQQNPDDVMLVYRDRTTTFRAVGDRVARLAGALRELGVGQGDRVAILGLNSDRYGEYLLAVPWADAVLNPVNIRWSPTEIIYSLADSQSSVLFIDDAFAPMLPALKAGYPDLETVIHYGDGPTPKGALSYEDLLAAAEPVEDARRGGDQLAGLFYTGGTTGFPKGVMLSHTNLITSTLGALATGYLPRPGARFLHAAPMFHLADLAGWMAQVILGGTHIIIPMFEPVAVLEAVADHKVTDTLLVPLMIQLIADHPACGDYDLTSMEHILYGASPISEAVLDRAMKTFPGAGFTQCYGMTELAPVATLLGPDDHAKDLLRSAGRAAPHVEIRIVDEAGNEVPRGTVGEIVVSGANVMLGYWHRPEATAAALREGRMHTGDGGYLDANGYLFVVDRIKDMIVSGGENVYSAEVENAIATHPAVASCAVVGVPDPDWGERVHAVVICQPDTALTLAELRDHTKSLIAGYKAPRTLDIVTELPVSGAGKILKRELRKQYWGDKARQVN